MRRITVNIETTAAGADVEIPGYGLVPNGSYVLVDEEGNDIVFGSLAGNEKWYDPANMQNEDPNLEDEGSND